MVYGLFRALPGEPGLFATVASRVFSQDLTPASGRQDHTTSPSASAPFVKGAAASTASRPASVTIASAPPEGRDGENIQAILFRKNRNIFRKGAGQQHQVTAWQRFARQANQEVPAGRG